MATEPKEQNRQIKGRNFYQPEQLPFETKMVLVRFEPRTFAVSGVFDITRLSVQETLQFLKAL